MSVKVNPGGPSGQSQDSDRGPSDHVGNIDKTNSFRHHFDITTGRNTDLWERILTIKIDGRVVILTEKHFLPEFLVSTWTTTGFTLTNAFNTNSVVVCWQQLP